MLKKKYGDFLQSSLFLKLKQFLQLHWVQVSLILLLIIVLRFFPLLRGQTLYFGDNYSLMVPGKLFTAHWLRQGILPLWNPTIFAGLPWIGDVNQSVFYPSTLLFMWFKPAVALNLTLVLHVALTFIGMYLVGKKILNNHLSAMVAAIIWTLSTQITAVLNNISTLQSLSWLPLVVYLGLFIHDKFKYRLFFALAIFFQFSGGYPSHVLYSILLAVFFSFLNKSKNQSLWAWGLKWFQSALLSICLTAIIWLPFLEVLNNSTRTIQTSEQSFSGSLHPLELIKTIVPYFFDYPTEGIKWGPSWNSMPNVSMYFSWLGLLGLGFFTFKLKKTKQAYIWIIFLIISIIFSLGEYLPIDLSFLIGSSRGPSTALIVSIFLIALIVGKTLLTLQIKKRHLVLGFLAISLSIAGYLLVNINFYNLWQLLNDMAQNRLLNSPFHTIEKNRLIAQNISIYLIINSSLLLISLALLKTKRYLFFSAVLILDLVLNTQGMLFFAPKDVYPQDLSTFVFKERLVQDSQSRTLIRNYNSPYTDFGAYWEALAVRQPFSDSYIDEQELIEFNHLKRMSKGMTPDWNMVAGVNILNGYTTLMPIKMDELWNEQALVNPSINNLPTIKTDNELLADWAVKYYLVDHWFSRRENFLDYNLIQDKEYWGLYELPALGRFRFEGETLTNQHDPEFEINLTQENFSETPNRIELTVNNAAEHQYLTVADRYDSNWVATVNGELVEIGEVGHMRRISIQPGENCIQFNYRPKYFYYGALISGLGLLISISGFIIERKISNFHS